VTTAAELAAACAERFPESDVLLMAAAVADFRPRDPVDHKLKKSDPTTPLRVELEPTDDVLSALAQARRPEQVLVGFAAEHGEDAVAYGRAKLERKRLDAIVVTDISRPGNVFDATENEVTMIVAGGGDRRLARSSKEVIADGVLDEVEKLLVSSKESHDRAIRADADRAARV
jgi:phosphopantothenoylcysteine decarboxylase/phosphopantothenate--cysteine ligase